MTPWPLCIYQRKPLFAAAEHNHAAAAPAHNGIREVEAATAGVPTAPVQQQLLLADTPVLCGSQDDSEPFSGQAHYVISFRY